MRCCCGAVVRILFIVFSMTLYTMEPSSSSSEDHEIIELQPDYPMTAYKELKDLILHGDVTHIEQFIHEKKKETLATILHGQPEGYESLISYAHEKTLKKSIGPLTKRTVLLGLFHFTTIGAAIGHAYLNSNTGNVCKQQSPTAADIFNGLFDAAVIVQTIKSSYQLVTDLIYARNNDMILICNMLEQQARRLKADERLAPIDCPSFDVAHIPEVSSPHTGYPLRDYYLARQAIQKRNITQLTSILDAIKTHRPVLDRLLLARPASNESLLRIAQRNRDFEMVSVTGKRIANFSFDGGLTLLGVVQLLYNITEIANSSRGQSCSLETVRGFGILSIDTAVPVLSLCLTLLDMARTRNNADKLQEVNSSLKIEQILHDTIRTYLHDNQVTSILEVTPPEIDSSSLSKKNKSHKKKSKKNSQRTVQQGDQ